jgi:hypothetical protein
MLVAAGCGGSSVTPTATPPPTPTTPPSPTPIDLPLPAIIKQHLTNPAVVSLDRFEALAADDWKFDAEWATTSDNQTQILGHADWATYLDRVTPLSEGSAVYLRFKADENAEYGAYFESGAWDTPQYKRFGIYGLYPETNGFRGADAIPREELSGGLEVQPDVWYDLLLAVAPNGKFAAVIWDPDDPSANDSWAGTVDVRWKGQPWTFAITANNGYLWIDDFAVLTFTDLTAESP